MDDHGRGLVSDLTDFDVRNDKPSRLSDLTNWRVAMAYVLLVVAIVVAVLYASRTLSSDPAFTVSTGPGVATTGAPADAASTQSDPATSVVSSDAVEALSGTWTVYWTTSEGNERDAFTVVFAGTDRGTVEILNDDTEFDTHFRLNGNQVWFTFTRIFDIETNDSQTVRWPEISVFEGGFTGVGEISGEWAREDWEGVPDRKPPCAYKPDAVGFRSRLVREP